MKILKDLLYLIALITAGFCSFMMAFMLFNDKVISTLSAVGVILAIDRCIQIRYAKRAKEALIADSFTMAVGLWCSKNGLSVPNRENMEEVKSQLQAFIDNKAVPETDRTLAAFLMKPTPFNVRERVRRRQQQKVQNSTSH